MDRRTGAPPGPGAVRSGARGVTVPVWLFLPAAGGAHRDAVRRLPAAIRGCAVRRGRLCLAELRAPGLRTVAPPRSYLGACALRCPGGSVVAVADGGCADRTGAGTRDRQAEHRP